MKLTVAVQIAAMCVGTSLASLKDAALETFRKATTSVVLWKYPNDHSDLIKACEKWVDRYNMRRAIRDNDPAVSIKDGRLHVECYKAYFQDYKIAGTIEIPLTQSGVGLDFRKLDEEQYAKKAETVAQEQPLWTQLLTAYSDGNPIVSVVADAEKKTVYAEFLDPTTVTVYAKNMPLDAENKPIFSATLLSRSRVASKYCQHNVQITKLTIHIPSLSAKLTCGQEESKIPLIDFIGNDAEETDQSWARDHLQIQRDLPPTDAQRILKEHCRTIGSLDPSWSYDIARNRVCFACEYKVSVVGQGHGHPGFEYRRSYASIMVSTKTIVDKQCRDSDPIEA
jgi:hypothetical protein